jgi:hypothetical protein
LYHALHNPKIISHAGKTMAKKYGMVKLPYARFHLICNSYETGVSVSIMTSSYGTFSMSALNHTYFRNINPQISRHVIHIMRH